MTFDIEPNLYAERAIHERPLRPYYLRHVDRMTREGLHDKSAIAGELAFRDAELDRLREDRDAFRASSEIRGEEIERLRARVAELERLRELIMHETGEDADGMMPHEPREALYILRRAAESALAKDARREPVAWMNPYGGTLQVRITGLEYEKYTIPLYTAPPAQAVDARRYRRLFDCPEPFCYRGEVFETKVVADNAIDTDMRKTP